MRILGGRKFIKRFAGRMTAAVLAVAMAFTPLADALPLSKLFSGESSALSRVEAAGHGAITYEYYTVTLGNVVPASWLFVGTYLMSAKGVTPQVYQLALKTRETYSQPIAFYTSELDRGDWKNVEGAESLDTILPVGDSVSEETLYPYLITAVVGDDGVPRDPVSGEPINPFDINSPYEMENLPELDGIQDYYEGDALADPSTDSEKYLYQMLNNFFENDNLEEIDRENFDVISAYREYLELSEDPAELEQKWNDALLYNPVMYPREYREIMLVMRNWPNVRDEKTDRADGELDKLYDLYTKLQEEKYTEEADASLFVSDQVDSERRAEVYYNLLYNDNLTGSLLPDNDDRIEELMLRGTEIDAEHATLEAARVIAEGPIKQIQREIEELTNENESLRAQIDEENAAFTGSGREAELEAKRAELAALEAAFAPVQEKYDALNAEADAILAEREGLSAEQQALADEIAALKEEREQKKKDIEEQQAALWDEICGYEERLNAAELRKGELEEYQRAIAGLNAYKESIGYRIKYIQDQIREINNTSNPFVYLVNIWRKWRLEDDQDYLEFMITRISSDITYLELQATQIETELKLDTTIDLLRSAYDENTQKIAQLSAKGTAEEEAALNEKQNAYKELSGEQLKDIITRLNAVYSELNEFEPEYYEKKKALIAKQDEVDTFAAEIDPHYALVAGMEATVENNELLIRTKEALIPDLTPAVEAIDAQIDALQTEYDELDALMEEAKISPLEAKRNGILNEKTDVEAQLAEVSAALDENSDFYRQALSKNAELNSRKTDINKEIENIPSAYEAELSELNAAEDEKIAALSNIAYRKEEEISLATANEEELFASSESAKIDRSSELFALYVVLGRYDYLQKNADAYKKSDEVIASLTAQLTELDRKISDAEKRLSDARKEKGSDAEEAVKSTTELISNYMIQQATIEGQLLLLPKGDFYLHYIEVQRLFNEDILKFDDYKAGDDFYKYVESREKELDVTLDEMLSRINDWGDYAPGTIEEKQVEADAAWAAVDAAKTARDEKAAALKTKYDEKKESLTAELSDLQKKMDDTNAVLKDYSENVLPPLADSEVALKTQLDDVNARLAIAEADIEAAERLTREGFGAAPTLIMLKKAALDGTPDIGRKFDYIPTFSGDFVQDSKLSDTIDEAVKDSEKAYTGYVKSSMTRGETAADYTGYLMSRQVARRADDMQGALPYLQMIVDLTNIEAGQTIHQTRELSLLNAYLIPFSKADFVDGMTTELMVDYHYYIRAVTERDTVENSIYFVEDKLEYAYSVEEYFEEKGEGELIDRHITWLSNLLRELRSKLPVVDPDDYDDDLAELIKDSRQKEEEGDLKEKKKIDELIKIKLNGGSLDTDGTPPGDTPDDDLTPTDIDPYGRPTPEDLIPELMLDEIDNPDYDPVPDANKYKGAGGDLGDLADMLKANGAGPEITGPILAVEPLPGGNPVPSPNPVDTGNLDRDDINDAINDALGDGLDGLSDADKAAAAAALSEELDNLADDDLEAYLRGLLDQLLAEGNPYIYRQYVSDMSREYVSLAAVDRCRSATGFRYVSGDGAGSTTMSQIFGGSASYMFKVGSTEVNKNNGDKALLSIPAVSQTDSYIPGGGDTEYTYLFEDDAKKYLYVTGRYVRGTDIAILVTEGMEKRIKELVEALERESMITD